MALRMHDSSRDLALSNTTVSRPPGTTPAVTPSAISPESTFIPDFWNSSNTAVGVSDDRAWAEKMAQKQMDFQREMSNTAWQRGVEDMQKAGLNPALAYMQGGANTATGAMANTSSTEQQAHLQRERMMFSVLNTAIQAFGRVGGRSGGFTQNYFNVR